MFIYCGPCKREGEPEHETASAAEGTLGRGTRRAATSTGRGQLISTSGLRQRCTEERPRYRRGRAAHRGDTFWGSWARDGGD